MHASLISLVALLCLLLSTASTPARTAKDSWKRVRSNNFELIGNAGEKDIRQVGIKLEQFRDVLQRLLPKATFSTPVPSTVIVFKSDDAFKPYKPQYRGKPATVSGYFQAGEDVNYIALSTNANLESPYRIIFHEYTHLLINNFASNVPAWFNEGLAEYYSTFDVVDGQKAELGRVIANHVFLLREKWVPLRDLFAVDHSSELYNERDKKSIFYAESWALMHYLLLGKQGARQPQIGTFLAKLEAGLAAEEAFRQSFGIDLQSFEKELRAYVNRNSYPIQVATFKQKLEFDSTMQTTALTEAEGKTYLGDLLLHTNRLDDGERYLREALALDANLGPAHAALGMIAMRRQNLPAARDSFERAIALNSSHHLAHYYYAFALSRQGFGENTVINSYPSQDAEKMRAELKKAIELRPDFPESYHLLAFINVVTGEQLDEAAALLTRALKLSPGSERYRTMLAQVYLRKEDAVNARRIVEPIARNSANEQQRNHAQSVLRQVESLESYLANVRAARGAQPSEATMTTTTETISSSSSSSTSPAAVDQEAVRKKAELDTLREVLRKPAAGEEQAQGILTRIECRQRDVLLTFQIGSRSLRLTSAKFEEVDFTTYTAETSGEISCGPRQLAKPVIVIYRPAPNARARVDGEVLSVSLIPKDFVLAQ